MNLTTEQTMALISNAADPARTHTVRATVIRDKAGAVIKLKDGEVLDRDGHSNVAWFSCGMAEALTIRFALPGITAAEQNSVMASIQAFIAAADSPAEE